MAARPDDTIDYREASLQLTEWELNVLMSLELHEGEGRNIRWLARKWDEYLARVDREMSRAAREPPLTASGYP